MGCYDTENKGKKSKNRLTDYYQWQKTRKNYMFVSDTFSDDKKTL